MEDLIRKCDAVKAINIWLKFNVLPEIGEAILHEVPAVDINGVFDEWASHWFKDFEALKHRLEMHEEAMLKTMNGDAHKATYINALENRIKELETDRPSGEWIYCEDDEGQDGYRCSECGFFVPWYYDYEDSNYILDYKACPHCLARMKGTDDGADNI